MERNILLEPNYETEILALIRSNLPKQQLADKLSDYHENDIAGAVERLNAAERKTLYQILGTERVAEVFSYLEEPARYLQELAPESSAKLLSGMDADDAIDVLADLREESREKIVRLLDSETQKDIRRILSYEDDEIGSHMTNNYIVIRNSLSIRQAMHELVRQAGENDNISTLYVVDEKECFYGALDLKDLITAREHVPLESLIMTSFPYVRDHEKVSDCIEALKDYAEDSIPVLDAGNHILGIITAQDIVEAVDEEMGEDYAKLAGLSAEEDLQERTRDSMRKRLPWLLLLLFLGMGVSSVVGIFENVVAVLPIAICFQSLVLDMAGNVGTQSLAVTIRVLMDGDLQAKQKISLVWKETKVGFANGVFLGVLAFLVLGVYLILGKHGQFAAAFAISGCVGISLSIAMLISSMVGTLVPLLFAQLGIDPAVASGPLITTINDLVAVISYYGFVWLLLIRLLHLA